MKSMIFFAVLLIVECSALCTDACSYRRPSSIKTTNKDNDEGEQFFLDDDSPYNGMTNEALYFLHTSGFDPEVPDMPVVKDLIERKGRGKRNLFEKRVQARTGMSSSEISEKLVQQWASRLLDVEGMKETAHEESSKANKGDEDDNDDEKKSSPS